MRQVLTGLFRRYGLPRTIRVDNGTPFGGCGALGLSRLSVWWLRLGLRVEFSRPACPQDNGAHEQMHRVLKAETARPPAANARAQQRRFARWCWIHNYHRPHAALDQQTPASHYRPSPRPWPGRLPTWCYPARWTVLRPGANGRAWWADRQRVFGRAFQTVFRRRFPPLRDHAGGATPPALPPVPRTTRPCPPVQGLR